MKKFIEKIFKRKSSENKNEDLTSSSLIEEAVAVLLLRAANIDGKKDAKEIDAIKKLIIKQFNYDEQKTNALIDSASDKEESSTDLFEWSKIINDHYDLDSKKIVFSMMC